ncbi:MAG: hypothetical protein QOJ08_2513, partial [Ilumatobacteraceae bacterium]
MAIAVKTEPLPEIIEVIDDDADSLAYRTTTPSPEPAGPGVSRWIGPAAAAVLLVVVGIAVVSSAVDSKPSRPATPGLIKPEYFVADAPSGFSMFLAEARGEDGVDTAHFADAPAAELWATPDASATTGSWFVVSRGAQHSTGRNSYRTIVDGIEVVVEHDPASGQRRMSFTKDGQEMAITAFGWFDRQLVRLVRAVNVDGSAIRFSDGFFTSDHDRILLADPVSALFGLPVARVGYTTGSPSTLAETFTITVAGDNVQNEPQVARFALTHLASFNIGTTRAMIGQSAADPTFR